MVSRDDRGEKWGIQRKEISDLIASSSDGRLAKELQQMEALNQAILVVEGTLRWGEDQTLLLGGRRHNKTRWSRNRHLGLLASVQNRGVWCFHTETLGETAATIHRLESWSRKDRHSSVLRRPSLQSPFGRDASNKEWGMHVLQSAPGVGPELARAIIDHFGRLPLRPTVTRSDLEAVKGCGPKKAEAIIRAFGGELEPPTTSSPVEEDRVDDTNDRDGDEQVPEI